MSDLASMAEFTVSGAPNPADMRAKIGNTSKEQTMIAKPCRLPIAEQMAHLLLLEDGWYDGDGAPYTETFLLGARAALETIAADGVPMPYVYPTLENEVRAEWDVDDGAVVLTIDASGAEATLVIMDDDTDGAERVRCRVDDARLRRRLLEVFAVREDEATRSP